MKDRSRKKKKTSIFRIFLIPLIVIMLVQSMITIGTLIVRRTAGMLQEYSGGMMIRLVENRKVILQNDMIQRWAAVCGQEGTLHKLLEQFLTDRNMELEQVLNSDEMKDELLEQLFPECLNMLQGSTTTGIFVVLTGEDMQAKADYDGFFIRDSDPDINPANYTDLLLERGSICRESGIFPSIPPGPRIFIWTVRGTARTTAFSMSRGRRERHIRMRIP